MTTADLSFARIAYIEASWHQDIVSQARLTFTEEVTRQGILATNIDLVQVPGSLEIPLQAKLLAKSGQYQLIVASGFIIDGGIYRHDFVASTVLDAIMRVSLDAEIPILSVVLTPHHFHEHEDHHQFYYSHFAKKGREAASACLKTLENMQRFA